MVTTVKDAKHRPRRIAGVEGVSSPHTARDRSLHFRVPRSVANALERAAKEGRRTVSAWVAICVEDKLRSAGYLS
jgi:hypothetical protein